MRADRFGGQRRQVAGAPEQEDAFDLAEQAGEGFGDQQQERGERAGIVGRVGEMRTGLPQHAYDGIVRGGGELGAGHGAGLSC